MNDSSGLVVASERCPVCSAETASTICELPSYPLTELFVPAPSAEEKGAGLGHQLTFADQTVLYCDECCHAFLKNVISPEYLYHQDNYHTKSSASEGSKVSLSNFAAFITSNLQTKPNFALDVGGNDSSLLELIGAYGGAIVDPNALSFEGSPFQQVRTFFHMLQPEELERPVNVICSSHTLEHVVDVHQFFETAKKFTEHDTFFLQFPSLELMLESSRYDLIHHQHLHYFSLKSISILATSHGLGVVDYLFDTDHYGTLMVALRPKSRGTSITPTPQEARSFDIKHIQSSYEAFLALTKRENSAVEKLPNLFCYGASLMFPICRYYFPSLDQSGGILDQDEYKSALRFADVDLPILLDSADRKLHSVSIFISAVATKRAHRKIMQSLINRSAKYIFSPFGVF
jgi:hypothetical protein